MKAEGIENASLIDFHYCQGAFGTSLEEIRRAEDTEQSSRPWFVNCYEDGREITDDFPVKGVCVSSRIVEMMREMLSRAGRSNIKNLALSAKRSRAEFKSEVERIRAHQQEKQIDFTLGGRLDDEMQRKLIYDMVLVYDLWFDDTNVKESTKEGGEQDERQRV